MRIGRYLRMKAMDTRLRALRAPFGLPAEGALGSGKSRLPSKVNAIIETAIKKIISRQNSPMSRLSSRKSSLSASTPRQKPHPQPIQRPTFVHSQIALGHSQIISELTKGRAVPAGKNERRSREVDSPSPQPHPLHTFQKSEPLLERIRQFCL